MGASNSRTHRSRERRASHNGRPQGRPAPPIPSGGSTINQYPGQAVHHATPYGQPMFVGGPPPQRGYGGNPFYMENRAALTAFMGRLPQQPAPPPPPPNMQRTFTIKNDVNLKKQTLALEKRGEGIFDLKFTFDCAVSCEIQVYYVATENAGRDGDITYKSKHPHGEAPRSFGEGLGQEYRTSGSTGLFVSKIPAAELRYGGQNTYPVVIRLNATGNTNPDAVSSQSTFATINETNGTYSIQVLKQKIQVGTMTYELQEIYGIEHNKDRGSGEVEDDLDGKDCVVCLSTPRDTTVLPCRHMCLCADCAKMLRTQSNKCPICRCHVDSLLQIKVSGQDSQ